MNGNILANRSAADRNKTDFYPTPPDVTEALINFLESKRLLLAGDAILEPACGTGEMAEVMKKRRYAVYCSDLYPTTYPGCGPSRDFYSIDNTDCDWIITNPPFSEAEKFIRHALTLGKPCAFLLKSQFWHAARRLPLYQQYPPHYVLPLTWRPDFLWGAKSSSPTMEVLWTVWHPGWLKNYTEYIPLERPVIKP